MSFFRHKSKKIKYENFESEKNTENETAINANISTETVNLFINNFVDSRDSLNSNSTKLNYRENVCKSWDGIIPKRNYDSDHFRQTLSAMETRKYATFQRIKRRMENLKNFYPDIYNSERSVIEMWARQKELNQINLDVLDYDNEAATWIWI